MVTLCDYCNKIATNTCTLCGKRVCEDHYDPATGLCPAHKFGRKIEGSAEDKRRKKAKK